VTLVAVVGGPFRRPSGLLSSTLALSGMRAQTIWCLPVIKPAAGQTNIYRGAIVDAGATLIAAIILCLVTAS